MQSGPSSATRPAHRATESSVHAFNLDNTTPVAQPPTAIPSFNANAPYERIISSTINRIKTKLPCNSGTPVSVLEQDEAFNQAVATIVHLSRHRLDHITMTLCDMLDKMHGDNPAHENDLAYYQSQLLLAKILASAMYFRWESHKEETINMAGNHQPISPNEVNGTDSSVWIDPPALDDKVAKYTMSVMVLYMKQTSSWCDRPKASGHIHSDTHYDDESIDNQVFFPSSMAKSPLPVTSSLSRRQGPTTRRTASIGGIGTPLNISEFGPSAKVVPFSSPILASTVASVNALISKYINKIIFYISASNWPVVFARIRQKIHFFASGSEEIHDNTDMKLLSYCAMDQKRLTQLFQELSSLLVSMKREAQSSISLYLRNSIWNWVNGFPEQFGEVIVSQRKLEGAPERVFDTLYQMMQDSSIINNSRRIIWPTLAALLATSPERLRQSEAAMTGMTGGSSRTLNAYLPTVSATLLNRDTKQSDVAMVCYLDLCKAAISLPSSVDQSALRSLAPDLAHELRSRIMSPSQGFKPFYESYDPIDVNLYADVLAAIFRFHPVEAMRSVFVTCLASESDAVKTCVVRCFVTLISEAKKYEMQPSVEPLYGKFAKSLRDVLLGVLRKHEQDPSSRQLHSKSTVRPWAKKYGADYYSDSNLLLLTLLTLYRLDVAFYFHGLEDRSEDDTIRDCVVLLSPHQDPTIHATVAKTMHTIALGLSIIPPEDPVYDVARRHIHRMGLGILIASCAGAMVARSNIEYLRTYFSLINMVLWNWDLGFLDTTGAVWSNNGIIQMRALGAAASVTCLATAPLDIAVLAARTVRGLTQREVPLGALPQTIYAQDEDRTKVISTLQAIGDPNVPVLGRVAFQRRTRRLIRAMSRPNAVQAIGWAELFDYWVKITERYLSLVKTGSAPEEQKIEWQNTTLLCASLCGGVFLERDSYTKSLATFQSMSLWFISEPLPERFRRQSDFEALLREFVAALVELLIHEDPSVRDTAKEALGSESQFQLYSMILYQLDSVVTRLYDRRLPEWNPTNTPILVEQTISILKLIFDRVETVADATSITVDISHIMLQLAAFLHGWPNVLNTIRIKTKFCALSISLFVKSDIFPIKKSVSVRNSLLDSIHQWVTTLSEEWTGFNDQEQLLKMQAELDVSCIQAAATLLDKLRLQPLDGATGLDSGQAISRLFSKYLTFFVAALEKLGATEDSMSDRGSATSKPGNTLNKEQGNIRELAIMGISNMLSANMDAGLKHCLSYGYHDDPKMRATFILIFTRVLRQGARFDGVETAPTQPRQRRLCEMVKNDMLLAIAVCETTSVNEIDIMLPVMVNIFDTRSSLLALLKSLIDREVTRSDSPTELFRANTMCTRLLASVAKVHGYNYLRMILAPLVEEMSQNQTDRGFELDSNKLKADELQDNLNNIKRMAQIFLDVITGSAGLLPPLCRELCAHIADTVSERWPESKYAAVGGFLFLRFICPAIVSPETVDLPTDPSVRRGLLFITKIVQNLANNVLFGKEQFMVVLNPFLEDNILSVTHFLSEVVTLPEYDQEEPEEWHGTSYDEADSIVLHRFFHRSADKVGKELLSFTRLSTDDGGNQTGKQTWDNLCSTLVEMGQPITIPPPSKELASNHSFYQEFMRNNEHRPVEPVRDLFITLPTAPGHNPVYALLLHKINVEAIELDILTLHIFKTISSRNQTFDVIIDCTGFTSTSEVPLLWLKVFLERCPHDFVQNFSTAFILNSNNAAMKFLRKLFHMSGGIQIAKTCLAVSSLQDLKRHLPNVTFEGHLQAAEFEHEKVVVYNQVAQQSRHGMRLPVSLFICETHIRIISLRSQAIWPGLECHINEIILFADIGDVYNVSTGHDANEFIVRRSRYGGTLYFSSLERDAIVHTIRMAKGKSRVENVQAYERTYSPWEISATMLNIALLNLGSEDSTLRSTAYDLTCAVSSSLNYEDSQTIPINGGLVPANPQSLAWHISEKLSVHCPNLTLDFITEFARGFYKSPHSQKATCLYYLQPWIKNLSATPDPSTSAASMGTRLRESFRILIDLVVKDQTLSPVIQRTIWSEVAKLEPASISIALDELVRAAADGGIGSTRCTLAAETIVVISSISVRGKILSKLRKAIGKTTLRPSQTLVSNTSWNEVAAISRLVLYASYNTKIPAHNQLFVAEMAHIITLLAGSGPVLMRTTIHSMAMNLVQALFVSKADDTSVAPKLKQLLEEGHGSNVLKMFGLVSYGPIGEYGLPDSTSDTLSIDKLEELAKFMLKILSLGAQSSSGSNLINVWRARWMSLVVSTAFHCSYIQSRAFIVMGILANSDVDDDLVYQILVAFRNSLDPTPEMDIATPVGILRCLAKIITGTPRNGRYLTQIVWLGIALMEYGDVTMFAEAAQVLKVSLETLERQGALDDSSLTASFMEFRAPLEDVSAQIDDYIGLSFENNFSFSLSAIIIRGLRHPQTHVQEASSALLRTLLRLSVRNAPGAGDVPPSERTVPLDALGYFLALIPTVPTPSAVHTLMRDAGIGSNFIGNPEKYEDESGPARIPLQGLGIKDNGTALLVATVLGTMLNSATANPERETLFALLAEMSLAHPIVAAHIYESIQDRVLGAFTNSTNPTILSSVGVIFRASMLDTASQNIQGSRLNGSASTIGTMENPTQIASRAQLVLLEEMQMRGILSPHSFLPRSAGARLLHCIRELILRIIE
ncbi:Ras GTPase activating protein ira2 [Serendipita sp. 405]|nr:Ras GTPase activating protein ira2 [Serendipita sp. 405]